MEGVLLLEAAALFVPLATKLSSTPTHTHHADTHKVVSRRYQCALFQRQNLFSVLFFSFLHLFIHSFISFHFISFLFFSFLSVPDMGKAYYPASLQERQVVLPKFCLQGLAVGSISQKQRWIPVGTIISKQKNKQTIIQFLFITRTHVKNKVGRSFIFTVSSWGDLFCGPK